MCGLLFAKGLAVEQAQFMSALLQMRYRGPDDAGQIAQHGNCWLGHNRLAILDLSSRGRQPFYSQDQRYAIVFNGEIYNYRELARDYQIQMQTQCDTELLLALYIQEGPAMLQKLNGMFAMVILDTLTGDIFVARDRLGIKPLFYSQRGDALIFSSEPAPILELLKDYRIDEQGLRQYLKLRTFFNQRTLYQSIQSFPAGSYWLNGKWHTYWELPEDEQEAPTDSELYELLESAVTYRCLADVSVGTYLSGGLDSSIVSALAHRPDTWTAGFKSQNEFNWARQMAEHLQSNHREITVNPDTYHALAHEMIHIRKEPLSVPNEVLLYAMTQHVKTQNTVVLCGEGADELFFGYDRIFRWACNVTQFDLKTFSQYYAYGQHNDNEIVADALAPFMHLKTPWRIVAAFFQRAHLHGLLRRLDFATMLCSVEARVPFVDHRLVERMAGVHFNYRMENGIVKAPLKRCFRQLLPADIIERPKVGFPVPLAEVFPDADTDTPVFTRWLEFNLTQLKEELPDDCGLHLGRL